MEVSILLKMTKLPVQSISSFAVTASIKPLPPAKERMLSAELVHQHQRVYQQLYPSRIQQIPYFCEVYGRILLAGDIIGLTRPGSNTVTGKANGPWSYLVTTLDDQRYRRNRAHLRHSPAHSYQDDEDDYPQPNRRDNDNNQRNTIQENPSHIATSESAVENQPLRRSTRSTTRSERYAETHEYFIWKEGWDILLLVVLSLLLLILYYVIVTWQNTCS